MKQKETRIKVSIIVPFYNDERYIKECFDSIAAQTFDGPLECVFVDDCGTDKGGVILEHELAEYQGNIDFRLVHHDHNRGLSAARNTGIFHASGDYLFFLDSDDVITPQCIELLTSLAEKYPGVDLVQGDTVSDHRYVVLHKNIKREYYNDTKWIKRSCLDYTLPVTSWNKLVRRDLILQHRIFFKEGVIHEDELWLFFLAKHLQTVAVCFEKTYTYRVNPDGIMHKCFEGPKSYDPINAEIVQHLSRPHIAYELSRLVNGSSIKHLDIPYNKFTLRLLFHLRRKILGATPDIIKVAYRVAYKILLTFIEITFPRTSENQR